jgi:hypothetical protein
MLTDNSTQAFLRKLTEKEKEHSTKLYTESIREKENIHRQPTYKSQIANPKRIKTESASLTASSTHAAEWSLDITSLEREEIPELMDDWLCLPEGMYRFQKIYKRGDWEQ